MSGQESPGMCGLVVACGMVRDAECSSACVGPFEGGGHHPHYLQCSLVSGQTTGREHSPVPCVV